MNVWSMIFGEGISKPVEAVGKAVDSVFTSDEERLTRAEAMMRLKNSPYMAAMDIAMVEAQSKDVWTSRARPMVLYGFVLVFVLQNGLLPILWWAVQAWTGGAVAPPPAVLDMDSVMTVVSGVLGTSWIASRGAEKIAGRSK